MILLVGNNLADPMILYGHMLHSGHVTLCDQAMSFLYISNHVVWQSAWLRYVHEWSNNTTYLLSVLEILLVQRLLFISCGYCIQDHQPNILHPFPHLH